MLGDTENIFNKEPHTLLKFISVKSRKKLTGVALRNGFFRATEAVALLGFSSRQDLERENEISSTAVDRAERCRGGAL